jgi:hypothetical protein
LHNTSTPQFSVNIQTPSSTIVDVRKLPRDPTIWAHFCFRLIPF